MQQQRPQGRQEAMTKTPRFADILSTAWTQHGLKRVSTKVLQFPSEENHWTTIVHATVETDRGVYEAIGDANPENAGRMIAPHSIRFAESRGIARALRWATNAGEAVDVEMGDYSPDTRRQRDPDDELPDYEPPKPRPAPRPVAGGAPGETAEAAIKAQSPALPENALAAWRAKADELHATMIQNDQLKNAPKAPAVFNLSQLQSYVTQWEAKLAAVTRNGTKAGV